MPKQHRRTGSVLLGLLCALAVAVSGFQFAPAAPAQASVASDFNAGNIISDSLFYDGNAMGTADVQAFLNQQVTRCTLGDPGREVGKVVGWAGQTTRLSDKCLRDYTVTTTSRAANAYCSAYAGTANESAASIIAKVGRACGISQKVLLVMLEKEQSLVSDSWPNELQYFRAMGYACPDSGPNNSAACDTSQGGFMQQVYRAAWQLKVYRAFPTSYSYRPFQTNNILWHPNRECGTSQVYIENWATAALYIYTPYRPNQAALNAGWGTGDACSTYGNRNFYLFYKSWFGPTNAVSHASFDAASGKYNGIQVSGWARKLTDTSTAYVWVNVYDTSNALVTNKVIAANKPLGWFNSEFPGWGANHGFDDLVPAAPGSYRVEVLNSSVGGELVGTRRVSVPIGQGHVDAATQTVGGIRVQGWSVDFRTIDKPDTVRVVLDGKTLPQSFIADRSTSWINGLFPGAGNNHAFDFVVPATAGKHTLCVYGAVGKLGECSTIGLEASERGSLDTVERAPGGIRVTGWAVNLISANPSAVDVTVNGSKTAVSADRPLSWFNALYPGAGSNHGFDAVVPVSVPKSGTYEVCIVGKATGKTLSCKSATLLGGETTAFDTATATVGQIRVTGWSAVLGKPDPSYVWVRVDGAGQMYVANTNLSWFDGYAPGSGNNHGFDLTLPASPGAHEVCVFTGRTGASAGCKTVNVPKPQEQGHLDSVTAENGSIRATGWSHIVGQPAPSYIWVDVDGTGKAYRADTALSWFNAFAPGQGAQHGFDVTIPAPVGTHRVCVSGANGPTSYGCQNVAVK